jgi:CubicO group peptidase (beta-lactamase class C family)
VTSTVSNERFFPSAGAEPAPAFCGSLRIAQTRLHFAPELKRPVLGNRDARLFPGITLGFVTVGDVLVPIQRGEMVAESAGTTASYWCVIPQFGRVWRERGAGAWSQAAFPLMLVSDTENHAHQGLASFQYREGEVSELRLQFVQQTAPYLLKQHFIAWGLAPATLEAPGEMDLQAVQFAATRELAGRLPAKPWSLLNGTARKTRGPVDPKWVLQTAAVRDGTLYYQDVQTPCGPYPYPLEMRFGVRSVMKSIAAPLALLRLAQVYGPYVLTLKVGDYVTGLHPKYRSVRFIDAANMATGFGGTGTFNTHPNDVMDGYLDGDYDAWYTEPSHEEKLRWISRSLRPYPWEPGTVMRYRDQDYYLLGAAVDGFLKTVRGPRADAWEMLKREVFACIGISQAPAVRSLGSGGAQGIVWFNAGYYPTLDDLAKIALLYQSGGAHAGSQILHPGLTRQLLEARDAIVKKGDRSLERGVDAGDGELYKMGFHFRPYIDSGSSQRGYLPTMWGSGESELVLYPDGFVSIQIAKAAELPEGGEASSPPAQKA